MYFCITILQTICFIPCDIPKDIAKDIPKDIRKYNAECVGTYTTIFLKLCTKCQIKLNNCVKNHS